MGLLEISKSELIKSFPTVPSTRETSATNGRSENESRKNLSEHEKRSNQGPSEKSVIEAIEKANKDLISQKVNLKFSIHKETKEIVVKVINTETKEVLREIPSEKILDLVAKMWERAGLFVDERR